MPQSLCLSLAATDLERDLRKLIHRVSCVPASQKFLRGDTTSTLRTIYSALKMENIVSYVSEITCTGDTFRSRSLFVSPYTSARRVQLNRTEQVRRSVDRNSLYLQVLVITSRHSKKIRIKVTQFSDSFASITNYLMTHILSTLLQYCYIPLIESSTLITIGLARKSNGESL